MRTIHNGDRSSMRQVYIYQHTGAGLAHNARTLPTRYSCKPPLSSLASSDRSHHSNVVSNRIPSYFLLAAAFVLSALAAAVPRDDPDVLDGIDVQPFLEPTNTTIWRPNTTARIAWITNASDPNVMLPVHYAHPLTIRLWKLTNGSALGELPVVFSEVAYRDDGSVNVTVPFLEEGDGFIVTVRTNTTDHRTWYSSEQFTVQRGDD